MKVMFQSLNEICPPLRGVYEIQDELEKTTVRPTGVYDAICANGLVTTKNRQYSRKDFVNAQKFYFAPTPVLEKNKDRLNVSIVDEFKDDGTIRLDRIVGQVTTMQIIDNPTTQTWEVMMRFAILDISDRLNPWFSTMTPLLTKLHGFYKLIPCGKGEIEEVDGVEIVRNFQLRYMMLVCGSAFQNIDLIQPVFQSPKDVPTTRPQMGMSLPQSNLHNKPLPNIFGQPGGVDRRKTTNIFDTRSIKSRIRRQDGGVFSRRPTN